MPHRVFSTRGLPGRPGNPFREVRRAAPFKGHAYRPAPGGGAFAHPAKASGKKKARAPGCMLKPAKRKALRVMMVRPVRFERMAFRVGV